MLLNGIKKYTLPMGTESPLTRLLNVELQDFYTVVNFKEKEWCRSNLEFCLIKYKVWGDYFNTAGKATVALYCLDLVL